MRRSVWRLCLTLAFVASVPGTSSAVTREIAELETIRLTFDRSILNQLTFETYREPFDELQTRPYNLLFQNIGRHSNASPWPGQEGAYTRYLNALIGNNGTANVDNDADSVQGSMIRRETPAWAWGVSAAFLAGENGDTDSAGATTFADTDDLHGIDVRGAAAHRISDRRVLGAGFRVIEAGSELSSRDFENGVGGSTGTDEFSQLELRLDAGVRQFHDALSSWEAQVEVGFGESEQDVFSQSLDDTGAVAGSFVTTNYDVSDLSLGAWVGHNRLRRERIGESEYRLGVERSQRELDNNDLAENDTLVGQDAIERTRLYASAKTVFRAGETEVFAGGQLIYGMLEGSTRIDAAGIPSSETIDDTELRVGATVGVRQPLFRDKLRVIASGRADLLNFETSTVFETGSTTDDSTLTTAQYAIGLEGVLSNVTFDLAWLFSEEAPVVPVGLGLPAGSRRVVEFDRLVFSAAVGW